jgi:transcriptional regulator with XRE-family HTH domain
MLDDTAHVGSAAEPELGRLSPVANTPAPTVRQRRVGRKLREWRKKFDLTIDQVAKKTGWSPAKVSRFERADTNAGPAEVVALATLLGISDHERDRVVALAVGSIEDPGWWRSYGSEPVRGDLADAIETESEASSVRNVETMLIPGLLQTAAYAEALVRAWLLEPNEHVVEGRSRIREQRQARLTDSDNPLHFHTIVHESALIQRIGGKQTMAEQLNHLLATTTQPNVVLQVLPLDVGAYPGFGTSYHLIHFDEGEAAAVYLENLNDGLYVEETSDIAAYTLNFNQLQELSLNPEASADLISTYRDNLT